jgi:hypothetical protein
MRFISTTAVLQKVDHVLAVHRPDSMRPAAPTPTHVPEEASP